MRVLAARLRSALVVSIVVTAVSLPVTASALLPPIDLPLLPPIDLPPLPPVVPTTLPVPPVDPNLGCGNGYGNGNDCSTTTTTTAPTTVPTTVPVTTTVPGPGHGTVPVTVPATTVPVPPTTPPGHTTATTGAAPTTLPAVVPSTQPGDFGDEPVRPPVVTPVGTPPPVPVGTPPVDPPAVGFRGFDTAAMAPQMVGAVKMLEGRDDEVVDDPPVTDATTGMSGGLHDLLSPVLPPALVDAVASPLVIMDALYDAFTSSGQALIVPGIAFLFGFGVPGLRRRITLDEVID